MDSSKSRKTNKRSFKYTPILSREYKCTACGRVSSETEIVYTPKKVRSCTKCKNKVKRIH